MKGSGSQERQTEVSGVQDTQIGKSPGNKKGGEGDGGSGGTRKVNVGLSGAPKDKPSCPARSRWKSEEF